MQYFPPEDQEALFQAAQTQEIQTLLAEGKSGNTLIECLGEVWYNGACTHGLNRDYIGGPTVLEYGERTAAAYDRKIKSDGTQTCPKDNVSTNTQTKQDLQSGKP